MHDNRTLTCSLARALFDGDAKPTILCDKELRVLAVNRAASRIVSAPAARTLAHVLGALVPPDIADPDGAREWAVHAALRARATELPDGWAIHLTPLAGAADAPPFVGRSEETRELLEFVDRIAASKASSILLEAETGAGKEVIARRLHARSTRSSGRFVAVNCAAMPETLLESELFGYEKGAFTDARTSRPGLIEAASGGTLFLDEIGEMPMGVQAKLLRVLEDHTLRRVGGLTDIHVDLRIIAATNRDLRVAIETREFRSDLYYRLNVVQIRLPALRSRPDDIEELAQHFLDHFNAVHGTNITSIDPRSLRMLRMHRWPGNVRELRNVIERAVLVESSSVLTPASLHIPGLSPEAVSAPRKRETNGGSLRVTSTDRDTVAAALAQVAGNQTRAAALLGIGRFSLRYKMRKFGLLP